MAASFTTGYTWSDGETITAEKLNNWINDATVADIDRAEQNAALRLIKIDGHAANDRIGETSWYSNWFSIQPTAGKNIVHPILMNDTTYTQSGNTISCALFTSEDTSLVTTAEVTDMSGADTIYVDIEDTGASPTFPRLIKLGSHEGGTYYSFALYGVMKVSRASDLNGDATIGDFAYAISTKITPNASGALDPAPIGVFMNSITTGQTGYIALWPGGF